MGLDPKTAGGVCRPIRPVGVVVAVLLLGLLVGGARAEGDACSDCHEESADLVSASLHEFLDCLDCHPGADDAGHPEVVSPPDCSGCHDDVEQSFAASVHGSVAAQEEFGPGGCSSCHGPIHGLKPESDLESPIHGDRLAETCGQCHADPEMAARLDILLVQPIAAYTASVHARAVSEGKGGARCSDCHSSHDILPAAHPDSKVNHARVPETCGQCHGAITEAFNDSVHGLAAAHGIRESPVCTDCHGEHRILGPDYEDSPVFATNIPKMTCGRCHGDLRLSEKFGMPEDMVPAYADSFHGLASRTGSVTVANCASCHGVHDILPSSDPRSHIHPANLAATCGHCHPGAGARFAIGPVHVLHNGKEHAAVYYARWIYIWLILSTVGGMLLHNLLDLYRKGRKLPEPIPGAAGTRLERLSPGFRAAHALLAVSFIVLAYTGFALKYPEAWWAAPLLQWESSVGLRGWVHRIAAVVMLGAGLVHLVHLAMDRRARACIAEMRPRRSDWVEFREKVAYLTGRSPDPPAEPWVGYAEKVEYLAVIWGSVVMGVTGVLLWLEEITLRWFPTWVVDLATVIHFYEAVLATLAIVVWHFYAVIFDPVVYPMDPAWLTGRSAPMRAGLRQVPRQRTSPERGQPFDLGEA
jgi:cytochrome b subunit of formate dehydrogenase